MSKVAPAQTSFNGGELSRRLRARIDQSLYAISCAEMVGFAPLVEGPAEAMPGTIHVAQLLGPSRLVRFEFSTTQGHALYFSEGKVQIFTNDALLTTIDSPYSYAQALELTFHQSFDVLYCFHPDMQPRLFFRDGADSFGFDLLTFTDGPFEPRNTDESVTVQANGVSGAVTVTATGADLFAETDVGALLRLEVKDFGDITAWEPYITVTSGQYLTANDRVYRVVGGNPDGEGAIRTGTLTPVHTEGVEWDGIAKGTDINGAPAGGVRLEYIHDRWGVLRIDAFTNATQVSATVLRHLPFSVTTSTTYVYTGGYYDGTYGEYVPPATAVAYSYGTYRWSFGSFSDTRGWPQCGTVSNERLCLGKDSTIYGSVAGDLSSWAERNEMGEVSNDMAFTAILQDPNPIRHLVAADRLLALTASGVYALGPASAAQGIGPGNIRADKQNSAGSATAAPVVLDSRTLHIDRSHSRIYETDLDGGRGVEQEIDLTRYARHIGRAGFVAIAAQQHPFNHVWTVTADGALAMAAYLPEEQVLGFARRAMATGLAARDLCSITDPDGLFDQVWLAAEYGGAWHALRMAPWRQDGESEDTACMMDMAALYEGEPATELTHPILPATDIEVVADGSFYSRTTADGTGAFSIAEPAEKVWAGLPFPAWIESLDFEMGGDNGPARGRKARFGRAWCEVADARGLAFGVPAQSDDRGSTADLVELEELQGDSPTDTPFAPFSGLKFREAVGTHTRHPRLRIERRAPFQATVLAWGGDLNMEKI